MAAGSGKGAGDSATKGSAGVDGKAVASTSGAGGRLSLERDFAVKAVPRERRLADCNQRRRVGVFVVSSISLRNS